MARKSAKVDKIDLKILGALQDNGRSSNLELAAKVGLSPSPCHNRHRSLEKSGIIRGYKADLDLTATSVAAKSLEVASASIKAQVTKALDAPALAGLTTKLDAHVTEIRAADYALDAADVDLILSRA